MSKNCDKGSNVTLVLMRTGRHRRFSRFSLALGAQRRRCRRGIHLLGETTDVGGGIQRTVCRACGAVAAIDLRHVPEPMLADLDVPARKPLWQ